MLLHPEWTLRDTFSPFSQVMSAAHQLTPSLPHPHSLQPPAPGTQSPCCTQTPAHTRAHTWKTTTQGRAGKELEKPGQTGPSTHRAQPSKLTSQLFICSCPFKSFTCLFYHSCSSQSTQIPLVPPLLPLQNILV